MEKHPTPLATQPLFMSKFIEIEYNPEACWIYANWMGIQDESTVKAGCEAILNALKEKKCVKILNDNRLVKGTWTSASDWVATNWFPRAINAGLSDFAWIYSPDVFSRFATDTTLKKKDHESPITMMTFQSMEEAQQWLQSI